MPAPTGILPAHAIETMIRKGQVIAVPDIERTQLQPASLDLRLGRVAFRLRASFLPGSSTNVMDKVGQIALHEVDLEDGAVLETGCVYLVPLIEQLSLPPRTAAAANPKSSTGRLDVFTRLITDGGAEFDQVAEGYRGPLFLEIVPRTFPILVRPGSRLAQIRFRRGTPTHTDQELKLLHDRDPIVEGIADIDQGLALHVDLGGDATGGLVGYRAKRHSSLIDIDCIGAYDPLDFWDLVHVRSDKRLVLDPDEFYILASKEAVHVPPTHAAEMVPYNPLVGEFRVHYAGFFDPGFGHAAAGGQGSRAVLEVRSHDVPFFLEDGQVIGRLVFERMTDRPLSLYGETLGSNYQRQGLKLSKHFRVS